MIVFDLKKSFAIYFLQNKLLDDHFGWVLTVLKGFKVAVLNELLGTITLKSKISRNKG